MARLIQLFSKHALVSALILVTVLVVAPSALAGKKFEGRWSVSITMPVAPNSSDKRTFNLNFDAGPRGESLHGRITILDEQGRTNSGVWRQVNKKVSATFELCPDDGGPCASLVLIGKIKDNSKIKKGDVIVMWDSGNQQNPALYDTSNGSFSANRLP
ncbi:MAG TPA: hypothetical protein VJX74_05915 [Blastocatellia bacterium]|nr:hypothetical protein [Blastocatellia bacterium]